MQMSLTDYDFSEEENYGEEYSCEVSAFCGLCDGELDSEEREHAARCGAGFAICTACLYDSDSGADQGAPSWGDQVMPPGWRKLGGEELIPERFRHLLNPEDIPGAVVLNLKPKVEKESTLIKREYKLTHWKLKLDGGAIAAIQMHAEFQRPEETGGLCFGPIGRRLITRVTWLPNRLVGPIRGGLYEPDGQEFFDQLQHWQGKGLEWKAWWHSHPEFSCFPSGIDTGNHKHQCAMLIYSPKTKELRGFNWNKQDSKELMELKLEKV